MPELRFPEFEEAWVEKSLGEVYSFKSTNSFSREKLNYESGSIKNIHYGDIHTKFKTHFDIKAEWVPFINQDVDTSKIPGDYFIQEGDLVIADASENYADIGKTIEIINVNKEKIVAGLHTFLARRKDDSPVVGFGGHFMKSFRLRLDIMRIAQGTKVLSISTSRLANIIINLPPPLEQQKIATFLTAVDKRIRLLQAKKINLEIYKKGVMQKLFSQALRFKDDDGRDFPDWVEKRLGEVGDFIGGGTPDSSREDYWNGDIPWISSSDIKDGKIQEIEISRFITKEAIKESATKLVPKNSILIVSRVGIGKFAVAPEELCTSQDFTNLITKENSFFLAYLFQIKVNLFFRLSQGTSIKGFTGKDLQNLKLLIPSIHEQQKIATFLTALDGAIDQIGQQVDAAQVYKYGLLQKMFV